MTAKLNPYAAAPDLMMRWTDVATQINDSLEHSLVELVKTRASTPKSPTRMAASSG
jgi:hypothetical protein